MIFCFSSRVYELDVLVEITKCALMLLLHGPKHKIYERLLNDFLRLFLVIVLI